MPRPRTPTTPASSTDIVGKDKLDSSEMKSAFSLFPPAVQPTTSNFSVSDDHVIATMQHTSPPPLPDAKPTGTSLQRKRTLSGTNKGKPDASLQSGAHVDNPLPPPPSRARKIIHMKPNRATNTTKEQATFNSAKQTSLKKESTAAPTSTSKMKPTQPSTTSAAGRKIARKTAHSIIERRRRSKMNEEFGVLKGMVPACEGVEMHKLAILQAGIEYLKYLEDCIEQLKAQNGVQHNSRHNTYESARPIEDEEDDNESVEVDPLALNSNSDDTSASVSAAVSEIDGCLPSITTRLSPADASQSTYIDRRPSVLTNTTNSTLPSPNLRPIHSFSNASAPSYYTPNSSTTVRTTQSQSDHSTSPPPLVPRTPTQTGISPVFNAFQFGPELNRIPSWYLVNGQIHYNKSSPNIPPLSQAAPPVPLPLPGMMLAPNFTARQTGSHNEGCAEATATAALMMMTKDRRDKPDKPPTVSGKGISVKDLLSS